MNERRNTNDRPTSYETLRIPQPRVWLTDAHNDHDGVWVDAVGSMAEVLDRSDGRSRILDSADFGSFQVRGDDDLETVCAVARGIARHGLAYAAWAELHDGDLVMLADFSDHYFGHFASYEAFGRNLYGATGRELEGEIPADLLPYVHIDFAALGRDELDRSHLLVLDAPDGGIYLFRGPNADEPHDAVDGP